ncbi:MAG: hypothetical protein ACI4VS_00160 [Candidatus Nanosyncoccaceae bacterium]
MRLREIKKKIDKVCINNELTIKIKQQIGNMYLITDCYETFRVLEILSKQKWNNIDFTKVQEIINTTDMSTKTDVMLSYDQYNCLITYINELNKSLPIFLAVIDSISPKQNECDINIKLSKNIKTLNDLNNTIKKFKDLEKFVNIDGKELSFTGFDNGSAWITISAETILVCSFIFACSQLARELLKTKEQYIKTKEAKINYKMSLKKAADYSKEGLEEYCKKYCEEFLREGAKEIAEKVGNYNNASMNEIEEKAKKATENLVEIIGDGNEIHISLNSNNITNENADGSISIDYSELKKILSKDKSEIKRIG